MIDYEGVGARMKLRRIELGQSLSEVAKKIDCTATTLKRWEDGYIRRTKEPCRRIERNICYLVNYSVENVDLR